MCKSAVRIDFRNVSFPCPWGFAQGRTVILRTSCKIVRAPCKSRANLTDVRSLPYEIWHPCHYRTVNFCQLYGGRSKSCNSKPYLEHIMSLCEFKMMEKSQPVVEFVAHVLNPSQKNRSHLRRLAGSNFSRWSCFVWTKSYEISQFLPAKTL